MIDATDLTMEKQREVELDAVEEPKVELNKKLSSGENESAKGSQQEDSSLPKTLAFFAADNKCARGKTITTAASPPPPEDNKTAATPDDANDESVLIDSIQPLPASAEAPRAEAPTEPGAYAVQTIRPARPQTGASLTNRAPTVPLIEDVPVQQQQHLAEAQPVPEHDSDTASLPLAEEYDHQDKQPMMTKEHCYLWIAASFSLLLAAIVLPVTLLSNNGNDQGHHLRQTQPPLSLQDRILRLLPNHTIQEIQRNVTTPQQQAFQWMLADPFATGYSSDRLLQRFALACFYHSTDGPRWTYNRNWLEYSRHECTWFSHDGSGNTTAPRSACQDANGFARLWLNGNQLRGTIPAELSLLTSLTSLSVHFNGLEGTIPSSLGALTNLDKLGAIGNSLRGALPTQLGLLSKLTAMGLLQNDLTGTVPSQLGLLASRLEWLFLDNNRFTGTIPLELFSMSRLTDFYFYNNLLTGTVPTQVGLLSSVEHLSLDFNLLVGTLPSELGLLSRVEDLALGYNAITGTLPTTLGLLGSSISDMKLAHNLISGPIPSQLGALGAGSFQYMMLGNNRITGTLPTELARLGNLTWLSVPNNQITGTLPTELARLGRLTLLSVGSNRLSGSVPEELAQEGKSSLVFVNVSDNPELLGSVPEELCRIGDNVTSYHGYPIRSYGFFFDCASASASANNETGLCGCHCPCQ